MTWGIVTTLKESVEQTLGFVNHYLTLGADEIYIFFDDPNDPAIERLPNSKKIMITRCTDVHWQAYLGHPPGRHMDKQCCGIRLAYNWCSVDWLISVDCDELIWCKGSVDAHLNNVPSNIEAVRVLPYEGIYNGDDGFPKKGVPFATNYFKVPAFALDDTEDANDFYKEVGNFTQFGFFGHILGKSFVRTNTKLWQYRPHISRKNGYSYPINVVSRDFKLLHFDATDYEAWKNKMWRRIYGTTKALDVDPWRKRLQEQFRRDFDERGDEGVRNLFMRCYTRSQKELNAAIDRGLVVKVERGLDFIP